MPYLNSVPFFRGLALGARYPVTDCVPRALGAKAAAGEIAAGPLPLIEYFRLRDTFERLGHFGIAVRGRAHSALLFSRVPIRQLDDATIAVTEDTSTTACLLRLILEQRYRLGPRAYTRVKLEASGGQGLEADALLLIGDEALRFRRTNTQYPYEIDVAFEWWLWQHLPFVFAVWAVRTDAGDDEKKRLEASVARALSANLRELERIAEESAPRFAMPAAELHTYLSSFIYRLGRLEEEAIERFKGLVDEHHLL